jgi:hypothetical protein
MLHRGSPGRRRDDPQSTRLTFQPDVRHINRAPCERQGPAEPSRWPKRVGARQTADLAELKDWVEGLRAAAHKARNAGNVTLAEALDITHFEVYESYLDEDYTNNRAKRLLIKSEACVEPSVWVGSPVGRMA